MTDETLFAAAMESPDRAAFLAHACPDPDQRGRVERLLAAHDRATGFLQNHAAPPREEPRTHPHADGEDHDIDESLGFLSPSKRPDSLGRLGHYEVLEVLGRGGFGVVFRAFDEVLQRIVAVKVMLPSMAATSPARKRFLREARSSAAIRHENVVQVHAVEEQPLPFIVMEFVPGESLQQRLDRAGPLDVTEVLRIGRHVAEGLAAAHATGVVHRDIKPANVLVEPGLGGRVRITDFGLARAADDASLARSGTVAGTPLYMAPEQARGETLDHRADLFSLGSVLYAVLTGRPPFRADTTLGVLKRVADDTPRPIREVIPEVPEWFCRVIDKLHAKDPAARYQTAREVADVLADCEAQLAAHRELKDFSRIPGPPPKRRARLGLEWAAALAVVLIVFGVKFGPWLVRYATGVGRVEIGAADGWVAVRADRDGRAVTEWCEVNATRHIDLPPGRYTLEPRFSAGREVLHWEVTATGRASERAFYRFGRAPEITVARGERITVRPVMRDTPTSPKLEPVLLKRFDPAKDTPTVPWGDPKNVRPEDGGWRIENDTNFGNFRATLGTLTDDLPTEGLVVFKAKVKVKAKDKITWGDLRLGIGGPNFHGHDWPEERGEYRGDVPEWTEKELQYPASVFHKRNPAEIPVYVGMYSNGVVWVKDAEVWHIPVDPRKAAVLKPLRDAVAAMTSTLERVKKQHEVGQVSKIEVRHAEGDVVAARVAYSEAEGDAKSLAERLKELVKARQDERDLIQLRVEAGIERVEVLNQAEARLGEAKARQAKAKP